MKAFIMAITAPLLLIFLALLNDNSELLLGGFLFAFLVALAGYVNFKMGRWQRPGRGSGTQELPPYLHAPGMRIEKNPYLPLLMDCSRCSKVFRLFVNSGALEGFEGSDQTIGTTKCPICGELQDFSAKNTRAVSFKEAEKYPTG